MTSALTLFRTSFLRATWLIARSVLIEAVRRKEIYAIVLVSVLVIGAVMTMEFFKLEGITKFYREIALQVMGTASGLTAIVLAARQLPREFENRTIYPLLAKPISRTMFLSGKLAGVLLAAAFCFAIFMGIYLLGSIYLNGFAELRSFNTMALFAQHIYLQLVGLVVLASLAFLLSLVMNLDAAITVCAIYYLASPVITNAMITLYEVADPLAQKTMVLMNYALPQITLFDLSEKATHTDWEPLGAGTMAALTVYGGFFAAIFFGGALAAMRRRAL